MKPVSPWLLLALLFTVCFSVATTVALRPLGGSQRTETDSVVKMLLGDGRRMFANQFITMADVYFHSGYYPSIFDRREAPKPTALHGAEAEHDHHAHDEEGRCLHEEADEHEKAMAFLGEPRDWVERFGRRFRITDHTHLAEGQEREILPWLRMAADLDPQMVQTYTIAAFWLRKQLGKVAEAEAFLREGVRNNPNSFEILFELGRLYYENHKDAHRARNTWLLALRRWDRQTPEAKADSMFSFEQITVSLARLEDAEGNWQRAIQYFELAKQASPHPEALQKQIDEIEAKVVGTPPTPVAPAP